LIRCPGVAVMQIGGDSLVTVYAVLLVGLPWTDMDKNPLKSTIFFVHGNPALLRKRRLIIPWSLVQVQHALPFLCLSLCYQIHSKNRETEVYLAAM
jgi:hypothetical protein